MKTIGSNWIWITVVIPVVIGMFKTELGNLLKAYRTYKLRVFEVGSKAQLFNGAAGCWGGIVSIEDYKFSLSAATRGVYIRHEDGGAEKVGILEWATWRKRPALEGKI